MKVLKASEEAMEYILRNAENKGVYLSKFLSKEEQDILSKMCGKRFFVYFDGGYEEATLKRALVSTFEIEKPNLKIACVKLTFDSRFFKLKHSTIKWHFLNIGYDEKLFGDIIQDEEFFVINIAEEIVENVLNDSTRINRCSITYEIIENYENNNLKEEYIAYCSSLRLDNVCARIFKMSREKSQKFIANDMVKVNGQLINKETAIVKEGDTISMQTKGKAIILRIEINDKTKRYRIIHNCFLRKNERKS